ncbi:hypothetical protein E4P39_01835 [Blastococcus sp. CT_GayMR19]|uniref:hypothetical protein n=1 Tax=Blastococcus sp. CT_GayMR19 TaxID=2559608 RepID=UPI001073D6A6|nr:hypothetical protein [Blastococcus sp. CT_GayMR19]TFV79404.1 hypothetical protein E4P39_01835 [Blastococcus sp. CT_GayMR19]
MATSLGQLLDALADTARATDDSAAARADAGTALGHLGRALAHLRRDGVSPFAGDRREQQVAALAAACTELGVRAPATESALTRLAAAAADTLAVLHPDATVASRWAAATAVAETITPLTEIIAPGLPDGPAAEWLTETQHQAVLMLQAAALDPPFRADTVLLDRPVPGPADDASVDAALVVSDTVGVLLRATARASDPPSVVEVLAYTIAAQTLSSAAERLGPADAPAAGRPRASDAWRAVRGALRPYDDGSRRHHEHAPHGVTAAGRLHAVLSAAGPDPTAWTASLRGSVAAGVQHLPTFASQLLYRTVRHWADSGALIGYARDMPPREERVAAFLRGYQPGGMVRAHADDLRPVVGALHNARLLSLAVADQAADPAVRATAAFPQRAWAANREVLDNPQTPLALSAARQRSHEQPQATRARFGPGRAR